MTDLHDVEAQINDEEQSQITPDHESSHGKGKNCRLRLCCYMSPDIVVHQILTSGGRPSPCKVGVDVAVWITLDAHFNLWRYCTHLAPVTGVPSFSVFYIFLAALTFYPHC